MSPDGRLRRRLLVLAVVLAVVVLVAFSGALVMSLFYYVGVEDGQLAVFSGLPVSVGPLRLHAVYRLSPVPYRTLSPAARGVVDQERVGTRGEVLNLAAQLGMWP